MYLGAEKPKLKFNFNILILQGSPFPGRQAEFGRGAIGAWPQSVLEVRGSVVHVHADHADVGPVVGESVISILCAFSLLQLNVSRF